jgi:hypothetical protein
MKPRNKIIGYGFYFSSISAVVIATWIITDAKVRIAGYKNLYECTNCHKFIPIVESEVIDTRDPQYLENSWEDD